MLSFLNMIEQAAVKRKRYCPNENFCNCNWETKRFECSCKSNECRNSFRLPSDENFQFTFANRSYKFFNEIHINNIERFDHTYFLDTKFASEFKLSIQATKYLEKHFLSNITGLQNLEIIYNDLIKIEPLAFDYLRCGTFSFLSMGKNFPLNLNSFGPNTDINNLLLDFHSSNYLTKLFINSNPDWLILKSKIDLLNYSTYSLTKQQLNRHWSSQATIKNLYIQEVKGIEVLDQSFAPKFNGLERIEIFYTDINRISPNFGLLHSENLKYFTLRQSNLQIVQSGIFEQLVNLEYLDLSSNPIKIFEMESFKGLSALRILTLQSLTDTYVIDQSDICMLSYLPCNVDVYLDNYDESTVSCALIYLHELKNDTIKFRSSVNSNLFKSLPLNNIIYQRDAECKLREELKFCLLRTNRYDHCLVNSLDIKITKPTTFNNTETTRGNTTICFTILENALTNLPIRTENIQDGSNFLADVFIEFNNTTLPKTTEKRDLNFTNQNQIASIKNDSATLSHFNFSPLGMKNLELTSKAKNLSVLTNNSKENSKLNTNSNTKKATKLQSNTESYDKETYFQTSKSENFTVTKTTLANEITEIINIENEKREFILFISTLIPNTSKQIETSVKIVNEKENETLLDKDVILNDILSSTIGKNININKVDENLISEVSFKGKNYDEWLLIIITVLVVFCMIQFMIGILCVYVYFKKKFKTPVQCLTMQNDSLAKPTLFDKVEHRITSQDTGNQNILNFNKLPTRTNIFKKPKFVPRPPIQFLRESSVSMEKYEL